MPDSRPNSVGKVYAGLQTKMAQKPYLCGGKNLYGLYKGVSPPPSTTFQGCYTLWEVNINTWQLMDGLLLYKAVL